MSALAVATRAPRGLREPTPRVNLLPPEIGQRALGRRVVQFTAAGVVAWIAVLGLAFAFKSGQVSDARVARDESQTEVARLETRVAQLEEFRALNARLEARNALLASAMQDEISWTRVLNDLSLAFPGNSSLRTFNATMGAEGEQPMGAGPAAAVLQFDGYTVEDYAPGVESVLLELDKVRAFTDTYLTTAGTEEIGDSEVTKFTGAVRLDDSAYTRRYADGLPEGEQR